MTGVQIGNCSSFLAQLLCQLEIFNDSDSDDLKEGTVNSVRVKERDRGER